MANVTVTTGANFIPEVWSAKVQKATESKLVMANLVSRFDADVAGYGDTIHVPNLANIAARDKAAGTAVTFDANTEAVSDISINKHKYVAVLVEDIVKAQAKHDMLNLYTEKMGYGVAKAIDSDLLGLYSGLSQTVAGGSGITDANIISAVEYLDVADAPKDGRSLVIHPEALADIRALDKFTRYDATGGQGAAVSSDANKIAHAYGVDIFVSTNVAEVAGTPNVLKNLCFQKEAFALAMQKAPKVETEYSVDYIGWKTVSHAIYGVAEMRDTFGVLINLNS